MTLPRAMLLVLAEIEKRRIIPPAPRHGSTG
jgi:hypothetical protein